ncbi:hypothetical protein PGT21_022354 [Puccinia graminis f. sp. tritici]|uniref:Uncharacterized protein n=1 Tax=Puccinia graminis f. sp. tritici TaxID=56615 RepID=A0A5B0SHJ0_PUCGR|nr:hypothetical protein PGT21_022354 [Puccinia graminis f. sp. tritici]KAA1137307.1 hypothetical protein PGTUg99_002122 [Puccinia graminis f. sp. tritici]
MRTDTTWISPSQQAFIYHLKIFTLSSSPEALSSSNALDRVKVKDFQAESPQTVLTKISEALKLN